MTVDIPQELQDSVQASVRDGAFESEQELVGEALRLLQQRELRRQVLRDEIELGVRADSVAADAVFANLERRAAELAGNDDDAA